MNPTATYDDGGRSCEATTPPSPRRRGLKLLAFGWLALSLFWAGAIIVTDALAWPLALWIATTLGPLTLWRSRIDERPATAHDGESGRHPAPGTREEAG